MQQSEIECWNKIFTNGKIQESDLKHPKELFVVRTFVAYLQKFGYKVEPPFSLEVESENTREKRLFLIRLAKKIDQILKYTKESYACYYTDITIPVPNRIAKTLDILLNYFYFYTMFEENVSQLEQKVVQKHNNLLRDVHKLKRENEEQKEIAQQMRDESEKLTNALPATKKEKEIYYVKIKKAKEALPRIEMEVEQLQQKLKNLQTREVFLKSQIVNDEEVASLKVEQQDLESNISELVLQDNTLQSAFKNFMEQTTKIESLFNAVMQVKNVLRLEELQEFEEIIKRTKENEMKLLNLKNEVEAMVNASETMSKDLTTINEELKAKKNSFEHECRNRLNILSEKQKQCVEEKNKQNGLKNSLKDAEHSISEQREMYEYIMKSVEGIMSKYANTKSG